MKRSKTAVIGLGNRLLADEGAGLHAVNLLEKKMENETVDVDVVEAGTPGMNLLHQFDEREKIIFVDAGNCGIEPGQYRRFTPDDVVSLKKLKGHSLHEFDLIGFLEFAKKMGITANTDVVIYCIQASEIVMSEKLSLVVEKNLPGLIREIYGEVTAGTYGGKHA